MSAAPGRRERPPEDWQVYLASLEVFGMRPGLERVTELLARLGEPQRGFRAIHVVGTNGKSSTTRYCEALLRAHGLRAAAYLSPHIVGFVERVVVAGRAVSDEAFGAAVESVRRASAELPVELGPVTQFEALTVAAFVVMRDAGVEAAAIEAGLGGRLDATNVLAAPVVVLTSVGLEHTEVLGGTRDLIFAEKAAVIARGATAVFGPLDGLEPLAADVCRREAAVGLYAGRDVLVDGLPSDFSVTVGGERFGRLGVPTLAAYQTGNAALAIAACQALLGDLEPNAVRSALAGAHVPGRLQVVTRRPLLLADGAHNPDGVRALAGSLATVERPRPRVGVVAILRDKGIDEMLATLLPLFDAVVCTACSQARSLSADELAARVAAASTDATCEVAPLPAAAVARARELAGASGSVLVTGSLYLLADLAPLLGGAATVY